METLNKTDNSKKTARKSIKSLQKDLWNKGLLSPEWMSGGCKSGGGNGGDDDDLTYAKRAQTRWVWMELTSNGLTKYISTHWSRHRCILNHRRSSFRITFLLVEGVGCFVDVMRYVHGLADRQVHELLLERAEISRRDMYEFNDDYL